MVNPITWSWVRILNMLRFYSKEKSTWFKLFPIWYGYFTISSVTITNWSTSSKQLLDKSLWIYYLKAYQKYYITVRLNTKWLYKKRHYAKIILQFWNSLKINFDNDTCKCSIWYVKSQFEILINFGYQSVTPTTFSRTAHRYMAF